MKILRFWWEWTTLSLKTVRNEGVILWETEWVTHCDNQDLLASQDLIKEKSCLQMITWRFYFCTLIEESLLEFYVALLWQAWFGAMHAIPDTNQHLESTSNHVK